MSLKGSSSIKIEGLGLATFQLILTDKNKMATILCIGYIFNWDHSYSFSNDPNHSHKEPFKSYFQNVQILNVFGILCTVIEPPL